MQKDIDEDMDHVWGTVGGVTFYLFILLKAEDSVFVGHGSLNCLIKVCSFKCVVTNWILGSMVIPEVIGCSVL